MTFDVIEMLSWGFIALMVGVCIGARLAQREARIRAEAASRGPEWQLQICSCRVNGVSCTHLALPGQAHCRQHSLNPVTRNSV